LDLLREEEKEELQVQADQINRDNPPVQAFMVQSELPKVLAGERPSAIDKEGCYVYCWRMSIKDATL
jgi:hypothetical protein